MEINYAYLKNLLYIANKEYYSKVEEIKRLEGEKELFEGIISILNQDSKQILENKLFLCVLIETIYNNKDLPIRILLQIERIIKYSQDINMQDEYKKEKSKFTKVIKKITEDYEKVCIEYDLTSDFLTNNKLRKNIFVKIISNLKNNQKITIEQIDYLNKYFDEIQMTQNNQIKILELIRIHNMKVENLFKTVPPEDKYIILQMLSFGFVDLNDSNFEYDPKIEKEVSLQITIIDYYDTVEEYIQQFNNCYPDITIKQYVMLGIIKRIQIKILEQIELIKDKEFYVNKETRVEISNEFKKMIDIYTKLYDNYVQISNANAIIAEEENIKLTYAMKKSGKPYILDDIKQVQEEYLNRCLNLINSFKMGTIVNRQISGFEERYKEFKKLKDDQVRILVKHIEKNIFCIYGIGIKQDQKGSTMYTRICTRTDYSNLEDSLKNSESIEEQLKNYIKTNARTGNR